MRQLWQMDQMVAKAENWGCSMNYPDQKAILLAELEQYPQTWALTPVDGSKRPYRRGWQSEKPLSRDAIAQEVRTGRAKGVGLRSGQVSGGLLCIDFDGPSALPKYLELSGDTELPLTVGWTSGKQGRWQLAFAVPTEKWDAIATKKIPTGWDSSGKATEFLEIRWDGCQSVLAGSVHPETGSYHWLPGQSPQQCEVAPIPDWVFQLAAPVEKYQPAERIPTDPSQDAFDIRNFSYLLDGYRPGRRGWDTCKCPAHNGQSDNSLHIEQGTGAFICHGGCDSKDVYSAALELAKSRGYQVPDKRVGHRFADLGGWAFKLKQQLAKTIKRRSAWGVGRCGQVELEDVARKSAPAIAYQSEHRLDVWSESARQGAKFILDSSGTGSGKSFDAGKATPELFDARQIIYVSAEHRNPTTPTLKAWNDLEARHAGLVRDEFGKLRRAKSGEAYVVSPNCGRNGTISALRTKNIPGADTAGLVCKTCPQLEPCRAGAVFGYLHDRAKTLSQPRFRAHPDSLPDPADYDYSNVVLLWDEAAEIIKSHRSIEVRGTDLNNCALIFGQTIKALLPEKAYGTIADVLLNLGGFLIGFYKQPNRYGWQDSQIKEYLLTKRGSVEDGFDVGAIDVPALANVLKPDLNFLNTTSEHGVDLADLPRQVRKGFSESDATTTEQVMKQLALNWFPDFLNVLLGNVVGGSLRIQHGVLTITLPDQRLAQIAQAAKTNIFLDATASPEDLARVLGINSSEILTVQQAQPQTNNLEIIQVATMGRLGVGSDRSDYCQQRVDAIISQVEQDTTGKVGVIDFKRHTKDGDGRNRWWTDSRGVNDLEDCETLILVGTPCRNLSDLEAEFTVLYGRSPIDGTELIKYPIQVNNQPSPDLAPYFEMKVSADVEFRNFCRNRVLADINQAVGRLRAHRRPDQQLKVYFVGDYALDLPVTLRKASDITLEAASKTERVERAIRGAVQQLKATGQKVTQQAIASITGFTQGYVSRFRELLQTLLGESNSKSNNFEDPPDPPPDPVEATWLGNEHLPLLAESDPADLLEGVLTVFETYDEATWRQIWDAVAAATQIKILKALMFTLNSNELRSLSNAVGVMT